MADPLAADATPGDPLGAPPLLLLPQLPQQPPPPAPVGPLPPPAALPAAGDASTTPTVPITTVPTDVNNLLKLFRQLLALQQQQTAQMVAVINGLSAQLAQGNNVSNTLGWPPTSTALGSPAHTSPLMAHTGQAVGGAIASPNHTPQGGATGSVAGTLHLPNDIFIPSPGAPALARGQALPYFTSTFTQQKSDAHCMPVSSSSSFGGTYPPSGGQATPPGACLASPYAGCNTAAAGADTEDDTGSISGFFRSRGRSRNRCSGFARSSRSVRYRSPSTDVDDPNDGYAFNRERNETTCKSIPLKPFSISNKDQDFPIWIQQFEEVINISRNPHSQRRHHNYCLQWLSGSLETDAYAIWCDCFHAKSNWIELKKELEEKFEDPAICGEWRTNPEALMWDEGKESLQAFAARVKRKVNTYDAEFAVTEAAKANNYFMRFMSGMPDDYVQHLHLNLPTESRRIEEALEICICFQAYKSATSTTKTEIGAAIALRDPIMPSHVTKAETDIICLSKCLSATEKNHPNNKLLRKTSVTSIPLPDADATQASNPLATTQAAAPINLVNDLAPPTLIYNT